MDQNPNETYVSNQLVLTGFGAVVDEYNERQKEGLKNFQLKYKPGYGNAEALLHFSRSEQTGYVFFNKYELSVKNEQNVLQRKQTFYINVNRKPRQDTTEEGQKRHVRGVTYSLKEAYNLLMGRSVRKTFENDEGKKYQAWVSLDFKNTDKHGNFFYQKNLSYDLNAALQQHPIKEKETPLFLERLIDSLERGNLQKVTYALEGEEKALYVTASPNTALKGQALSNLAVFDVNQQPVPTQSVQIKSVQQQNADDTPRLSVDQKKAPVAQEKGEKVKENQQSKPKRTAKQRR